MPINSFKDDENVIKKNKTLTFSCETTPISLSYWRKALDMYTYTHLFLFSHMCIYVNEYMKYVSLCACVCVTKVG